MLITCATDIYKPIEDQVSNVDMRLLAASKAHKVSPISGPVRCHRYRTGLHRSYSSTSTTSDQSFFNIRPLVVFWRQQRNWGRAWLQERVSSIPYEPVIFRSQPCFENVCSAKPCKYSSRHVLAADRSLNDLWEHLQEVVPWGGSCW
jgi:hypothetical protein